MDRAERGLERWLALGIRPPLARLDTSGTYLHRTPKDITKLLGNYYLACNIGVRVRRSTVIVESGSLDVSLYVSRMPRGETIAEVVQATLDDPNEVYSYPLDKSFDLAFEAGEVTLDWVDRKSGIFLTLASFPLCIDLVEALVAAERL